MTLPERGSPRYHLLRAFACAAVVGLIILFGWLTRIPHDRPPADRLLILMTVCAGFVTWDLAAFLRKRTR
ncbi:hypothetical protein BKE38_11595 [Pseudoroseomonas deserti]|uniref:Uncharacterized protein n=1 Tax=Teichococcus deserti TaxID=1817963 RepID=A0A1V2H387_9PROT|nr:hypothetical protein [Pseudoroseomonas deserti]ONG53572.1 hypothetical protein BKE38_11595 [Pseudoroseomonas deserti]